MITVVDETGTIDDIHLQQNDPYHLLDPLIYANPGKHLYRATHLHRKLYSKYFSILPVHLGIVCSFPQVSR